MISVFQNYDNTGFAFTDVFNATNLVIGKLYDKLVTCVDFVGENCTTKITQIYNLSANASYDMDVKFMNGD